MPRLIWIEDVGAGQWHLTNGKHSLYLRQDYGLVSIAEDFGMRLRHNNGCSDRTSTDGTIACRSCGRTADQFYGQAHTFLAPRVEWGVRIIDPGYFLEEETA